MFSKIQMTTKFGKVAEQKSMYSAWQYEGVLGIFLFPKDFEGVDNALPLTNGCVGYWVERPGGVGYLHIAQVHKNIPVHVPFLDNEQEDRELQFFLDVAPVQRVLINNSYATKGFLVGLFLMPEDAIAAWWDWADHAHDGRFPSPGECMNWMQGISR